MLTRISNSKPNHSRCSKVGDRYKVILSLPWLLPLPRLLIATLQRLSWSPDASLRQRLWRAHIRGIWTSENGRFVFSVVDPTFEAARRERFLLTIPSIGLLESEKPFGGSPMNSGNDKDMIRLLVLGLKPQGRGFIKYR